MTLSIQNQFDFWSLAYASSISGQEAASKYPGSENTNDINSRAKDIADRALTDAKEKWGKIAQ